MGTHIFSLENVLWLVAFWNIHDQTNAIWIPVFVFMPSSQFTIWDNEIKPVTSQYTEEHSAMDPMDPFQGSSSGELFLDRS